jgi:hypothetical protein
MPHFGLWYHNGSTFDLIGYSYSDYVGCKVDRKSTSGTCQFLGTSLVCWSSNKQNSIALSTVETEYVAASQLCMQLLCMRQTLSGFSYNLSKVYSYVIMRVQSAWRIIPLNIATLGT